MINGKLSLFSLFGIEYYICLSAKIDNEDYKGFDDKSGLSDFNALSLKLGGQTGCFACRKNYLRFGALFGSKLSSKVEEDIENHIRANFAMLSYGEVEQGEIDQSHLDRKVGRRL
ncbi:MAG: hypothetical protein LBH18_05145 [Spirochaetaceae bacterium]|nr:hypothetical protein [Spirochaetaceae bacterium]